MDEFKPLPPHLIAAFERQAQACSSLGSPFTARLCALFADSGLPVSKLRERMMAWEGDTTSSGDALPVRLCGALHELVLSGRDAGLAELYPPRCAGRDDDRLIGAIGAAIRNHVDFLVARLCSPPQTNEVRRSTAIYAALLHIAACTQLPIRLSEIGASAGLNLLLDRYHHRLCDDQHGSINSPVSLAPDWRGPVPPRVALTIDERRGCDLSPFDLSKVEHRTKLLSYVWADQAERLNRMHAAIDVAVQSPAVVDRADAVEWLATNLATAAPGRAHVIFHTIAWQYLPEASKHAGRRLIETAGAMATADSPLFVVGLEDDGRRPGAALQLEAWPGGSRSLLARVDFHGRWIDWLA